MMSLEVLKDRASSRNRLKWLKSNEELGEEEAHVLVWEILENIDKICENSKVWGMWIVYFLMRRTFHLKSSRTIKLDTS